MSNETNDNVIKLTFVKDIPGMMRKTADEIEKGVYGDVTAAVFVVGTDDDYQVFGWGDAKEVEFIGLISVAQNIMAGG